MTLFTDFRDFFHSPENAVILKNSFVFLNIFFVLKHLEHIFHWSQNGDFVMFPNCVLSIKKIMLYFGCFLKGTTVGMRELITNIIFAICIYDNDNNNIPPQQQQIIKYSPH